MNLDSLQEQFHNQVVVPCILFIAMPYYGLTVAQMKEAREKYDDLLARYNRNCEMWRMARMN